MKHATPHKITVAYSYYIDYKAKFTMANLTIHGVSVARFQVREDIEKRLPDFPKYVDPQKAWFAMGVPQ
jgi:hypothetical protein